MLSEYKKKTNIGVGLGIIIQIIANVVSAGGEGNIIIGGLLGFVGTVFFIYGCVSYAKGKGHHGAWGILGLFSIIGLIILVLFPDRHKEA